MRLLLKVSRFTLPLKKQEEGEKPVIDQKKFEKDLRVRSLLGTCLSDSILRKVMHEKIALGMWKSLDNLVSSKHDLSEEAVLMFQNGRRQVN